jgi:hypothetical protein
MTLFILVQLEQPLASKTLDYTVLNSPAIVEAIPALA